MSTANLKTTPYWWDQSPLPTPAPTPLPETTDVLVVGGGYSGLFTALTVARGGRQVTLLEAGKFGEFASTRNFGAVGRTIRLSFSSLLKRYGEEVARAVFDEAKEWLEFTAQFIERENIDCRFFRNGRIVAAHSAAAYEESARELDFMSRYLKVDSYMVPAGEQRSELGSDAYHGGTVLTDVGHLDPGRYFAGVMGKVLDAGVTVIDGARVTAVNRRGDGFDVESSKGSLRATEVVLTTNAETGGDNVRFRYFRRRVVPVEAYSVVTEPLPAEVIAAVVPTGRTVLETRRLYTGLRPIEHENRLLAVGRHMQRFADEADAAQAVGQDLAVRYPQLDKVKFSHCWRGTFCVTFDWLPHFGTHDGVHYLIGLNGAGVPAAGYLGQKLGQRILGVSNSASIFADRSFPMRFGYNGETWFLPWLADFYRWQDRREAGLAR